MYRGLSWCSILLHKRWHKLILVSRTLPASYTATQPDTTRRTSYFVLCTIAADREQRTRSLAVIERMRTGKKFGPDPCSFWLVVHIMFRSGKTFTRVTDLLRTVGLPHKSIIFSEFYRSEYTSRLRGMHPRIQGRDQLR